MKANMVKEMDNGRNEKAASNCEGCIGGKMHRNPSPKASQHRATKAYEFVHSDVCGLMQVESKGGNRYMVTFIDNYSRFSVAYFIKRKSEGLAKFKEFDNNVKNQSSNK